MHWVKDNKCYQTEVPDLRVELALDHAGVAGSCFMDGFTQKDGEKTANIAPFGNVDFTIWEQASDLQNLASTTTMHWVKHGECF